MPKIPSLEELLQAGAHFGHQKSRWHPKMGRFIFGARQGVHIIDLEETQKQLESTLKYVSEVASKGGKILFLGTKRQAQAIVKAKAIECGMPYVTERWLGGTITNFNEIKNLIKKYNDLIDQQEKGELKKYTKKEQLMFSREIIRMAKFIEGVKDLKKIPDAIMIFDIRRDKTAKLEANTVGVPVIAVCDTNVNPSGVEHIIPANDDAVKSIELIASLVSEAVLEGKKQMPVAEVKPVVKAKDSATAAKPIPTVKDKE